MIESKLNENVVRIVKAFNIERELETGRDYELRVTASCVEKSKRDNHDGTHDFKYQLQLITGEIINDKGSSMVINAKSSYSQELRRKIFSRGLDYDTIAPVIIKNLDEIIERYSHDERT